MKITDDMLTERELFEAHFGVTIDQRRAPSAGGYAHREIQMMWAGWQAARRTTPDRDAIIEECAKVCDDHAKTSYLMEAAACARKIRALKTAPTSDQGEKS
ncbi:hypothetical protein [Burkholderia multivorans]|uniref:hypothetical protein n=1 Tax=Burkholderia multivorans TaxID=87883 RepID=UPI0028561E99|nr:hypothetical protein [Burkholderia multivorans]MDR8920498.1 hypothetical protein [Burkholderia multivorans]MDR8921903.1 hypothetical protein [Burkholderia multivorans]MDR8965966.1 hypothetical protein [Burkholderia multivorans]MDR8988560.1 hypothetical protein [Burkholderia multivorans]MDR9019559.1 hypothetical protein [Burkholderia multivorans]